MNEDDEEMLMSLIGKKRPIWVRTLSHYSKYSPVAKPVLPSDFTVVVLLQLFLHITRAHLKMSDSGSNLPLPTNSVLSCQLNRALRIGALMRLWRVSKRKCCFIFQIVKPLKAADLRFRLFDSTGVDQTRQHTEQKVVEELNWEFSWVLLPVTTKARACWARFDLLKLNCLAVHSHCISQLFVDDVSKATVINNCLIR